MMHRKAVPLAAAGLLAVALPAWGQVERTDDYTYQVVTVADGLQNPWGMVSLPDGDLLVIYYAGPKPDHTGLYWVRLRP